MSEWLLDIWENVKSISSKLLGETGALGQPDEFSRVFRGFGHFFQHGSNLFNSVNSLADMATNNKGLMTINQ